MKNIQEPEILVGKVPPLIHNFQWKVLGLHELKVKLHSCYQKRTFIVTWCGNMKHIFLKWHAIPKFRLLPVLRFQVIGWGHWRNRLSTSFYISSHMNWDLQMFGTNNRDLYIYKNKDGKPSTKSTRHVWYKSHWTLYNEELLLSRYMFVK